MKLLTSFFVLFAIVAVSAGRGKGKGKGKYDDDGDDDWFDDISDAFDGAKDHFTKVKCNATTSCPETERCTATMRGNYCVRRETEPCEGNTDCPESGNCFLPDGAQAGICGGCSESTDCNYSKENRFCLTKGRKTYGKCAACLETADCASTEYCRKGTCNEKKAATEDCKKDEECVSGECERESSNNGRRWWGWGNKKKTCQGGPEPTEPPADSTDTDSVKSG